MNKLRQVRHNIIVFSTIGLLFYGFNILKIMVTSKGAVTYNPLYYYGVDGLVISVVGGVFAYFYYRYQRIPIIRIIIWSVVWFFGVFVLGSIFQGVMLEVIGSCWLGLLTILFFMGVGAVNGLLGYWISIINVLVAIYCVFIAHDVNPFIWVSVLDIVGIQNVYLQWALLIISSILGIAKDGVALMDKLPSLE